MTARRNRTAVRRVAVIEEAHPGPELQPVMLALGVFVGSGFNGHAQR